MILILKYIMKKKLFLIKILLIYTFITANSFAKESVYFSQGIELFKKQQFDKSKIYFERDIVFNPKNDESYLYLAKIFNKKDNDMQQEINLKNVLLLDPKNDEAIYMLTLLKIKQSDYSEAEQLFKKFNLVCKTFCSKKSEIENKLDKLIPKDAKNNN